MSEDFLENLICVPIGIFLMILVWIVVKLKENLTKQPEEKNHVVVGNHQTP
jgi:1-acyl-sn-glycerol-3-phosphate acyltransferase